MPNNGSAQASGSRAQGSEDFNPRWGDRSFGSTASSRFRRRNGMRAHWCHTLHLEDVL